MRNFVVFTLILTLTFPAYCFSAPSGVPVCEESDKSIEEIIDAIEIILEDGKVEEEEIAALLEDIEPNNYLNPACFIILILLVSDVAEYSTVLAILLYVLLFAYCLVM